MECDTEYLRWQGQCDQCQSWNSLEPITIKKNKPSGTITESNAPVKIVDVKEPDTHRWASGFEELDRVLGGGWVYGSVNLLCGEPGIGKSTIVLQSLLELNTANKKTLYICRRIRHPS